MTGWGKEEGVWIGFDFIYNIQMYSGYNVMCSASKLFLLLK